MVDQRKIIHFDCDCFYASVEVRDNPALRGLPIAVGGSGRRGVLSTCSYEARKFGVRSAMPTGQAMKLCPDLLVLPARFDAYREASRQINDIFHHYSELVEPLSLDEAFVDVSEAPHFQGSATRIAEAVRQQVRVQVGITISAGVAPNKFLAKIASDWNKPDGIWVITPDQVADFVETLPVEKIHGVGKVTAQRLHNDGLYTCGEIRQRGLKELVAKYGAFGEHLYRLSHGLDKRQVKVSRARKSLSVERTFGDDLPDLASTLARLESVFLEFDRRMEKVDEEMRIGKGFVKIRFNDFTTTTIESSFKQLDLGFYRQLCEQGWLRQKKPVRLLGLGVRFRTQGEARQLDLFEAAANDGAVDTKPLAKEAQG